MTAQLISFDNRCRENDVLRYTEMLRRRSILRMAIAEGKHQKGMQEFSDRHSKTMYRIGVIGFVAVAVCFISSLVWSLVSM